MIEKGGPVHDDRIHRLSSGVRKQQRRIERRGSGKPAGGAQRHPLRQNERTSPEERLHADP